MKKMKRNKMFNPDEFIKNAKKEIEEETEGNQGQLHQGGHQGNPSQPADR